MDSIFRQIHRNQKLHPSFVRSRFAAVDNFLGLNGHVTMLELCQVPSGRNYVHDLLLKALDVFQVITLVSEGREMIINGKLANNQGCLGIILNASTVVGNHFKPEVIRLALNVLINLVCIEQGHYHAIQAVCANNGIKVLLGLLQPQTHPTPAVLHCIQSLACRVLLGLTRDDRVARTLAKLQVDRRLSELIHDSGSQTTGTVQSTSQAELIQEAIKLITIVKDPGHASALIVADTSTPTLSRIERAAVADATHVTYNSRELFQLIYHHLQASGLVATAAKLLEEAQIAPLPSLTAGSCLIKQDMQETPALQLQWPSGRAPSGFLSEKSKPVSCNEDSSLKLDLTMSSKEKLFLSLPNLGVPLNTGDCRHKSSSVCLMPTTIAKRSSVSVVGELSTPDPNLRDFHGRSTSSSLADHIDDEQYVTFTGLGFLSNHQPRYTKQHTLDSIVTQYLKQQHSLCPAPIATLPPLSLLDPHICTESKRSVDSRSNVTARLASRELGSIRSKIHGNCKDRHFVYSRFRQCGVCRDNSSFLSCIAFLGDFSHIAYGGQGGEVKTFDFNCNNVQQYCTSHLSPLIHIESHLSGETKLLLSSSKRDVCLWDVPSISGGPVHSLELCKAARFSNSGNMFAALSIKQPKHKVLIYDVQTCLVESTLSDTALPDVYSLVHFSPSDMTLLWNGVLWDRRQSGPIHRFEQLTDYGGGGFHPSGNQVIMNSEVWDLRNFQLLYSIPSLDQTIMTFNSGGDVIYAVLRRSLYKLPMGDPNPLRTSFSTLDGINYAEIARTPIDYEIVDMSVVDSFVGLVTMDTDNSKDMSASVRVYEAGVGD